MACDDCGKTTVAMFPMQPGKDGKPWELCSRCWIDGAKPTKLGMFGKAAEIADPHLYDALVSASKHTAGLINMDEGRADDPKSSVGDFDRKPRKRKAG